MPKSRRRFLVCFLAAVVVGLVIALWLTSPTAGPSRENALRLRRGMTGRQIEAILGGPGEPILGADDKVWELVRPGAEDHPEITVTLDDAGRLHHLKIWSADELLPAIQPDEQPFNRLRRWLGL